MAGSWFRKTVRFLVPIVIIVAGLGFARQLYMTKPTAKKRRPKDKTPLVEVAKVPAVTRAVKISAMGTMMPALTVDLKARVTGRVIWVSEEFVPGGVFKKGDVILKLDPSDYKIAVQKQESLVSRAAAELALEKGRGDVAREELRLMEKTSGRSVGDRGLALRAPQLAKVEADLTTARAELAQAKLFLTRVVLRAPFNCVVKSKAVEIGGQVGTQDSLAVLDGTDRGWVEATVPQDRLGWIRFPRGKGEKGSLVQVRPISGAERSGRVIRLLGDVTESRMAKVLVEVADPLGLSPGGDEAPLLTGSYVSVTIEGNILENVLPVPRSAVREGNSIWVADGGSLAIRNVRSVWSDREFLYVSQGLSPEDALIVSELSAPVEGMRLRMSGESRRLAGDAETGQGSGNDDRELSGKVNDPLEKIGKNGKAGKMEKPETEENPVKSARLEASAKPAI